MRAELGDEFRRTLMPVKGFHTFVIVNESEGFVCKCMNILFDLYVTVQYGESSMFFSHRCYTNLTTK